MFGHGPPPVVKTQTQKGRRAKVVCLLNQRNYQTRPDRTSSAVLGKITTGRVYSGAHLAVVIWTIDDQNRNNNKAKTTHVHYLFLSLVSSNCSPANAFPFLLQRDVRAHSRRSFSCSDRALRSSCRSFTFLHFHWAQLLVLIIARALAVMISPPPPPPPSHLINKKNDKSGQIQSEIASQEPRRQWNKTFTLIQEAPGVFYPFVVVVVAHFEFFSAKSTAHHTGRRAGRGVVKRLTPPLSLCSIRRWVKVEFKLFWGSWNKNDATTPERVSHFSNSGVNQNEEEVGASDRTRHRTTSFALGRHRCKFKRKEKNGVALQVKMGVVKAERAD